MHSIYSIIYYPVSSFLFYLFFANHSLTWPQKSEKKNKQGIKKSSACSRPICLIMLWHFYSLFVNYKKDVDPSDLGNLKLARRMRLASLTMLMMMMRHVLPVYLRRFLIYFHFPFSLKLLRSNLYTEILISF